MNLIAEANAPDLLKLVRTLAGQILPLLDIIDRRPDGTVESSGATENLQELAESLLATAGFIEKRHEEQAALVAQLQARVAELVEELEPHRVAELAQERHRIQQDRLAWIVNLLFPSYNGVRCRVHPEEKPHIHPAKAWWWNGASLESSQETASGDFLVEVQSYVGRGETDDFEMTAPAEWVTCADPKALVLEWIRVETARTNNEKREAAVKAAQQEIAEQMEKLADLTRK